MTGIVNSIFGGSSSGSGASQSSSQADPRVIQGYIDNLNRQNQMIGALPGINYAGFTPDQLAGFGATRTAATAGAPTVEQAVAQTQNLAGFTPQQVAAGTFLGANVSGYMSPFTQEVIDTTLSDLDRSRQMALQDVGAQASQSGAFGGSRQGVAEAETNRAFADQAARTVAQLRQAGFTQAADQAQADLNRQLQADLANQQIGLQGTQLGVDIANQLANLGLTQQQMGLTGAEALQDIGATQQELAQQQANAPRDSLLQQLALYNAAIGASPGTFSTSSTGSTQGKGIWETIFG